MTVWSTCVGTDGVVKASAHWEAYAAPDSVTTPPEWVEWAAETHETAFQDVALYLTVAGKIAILPAPRLCILKRVDAHQTQGLRSQSVRDAIEVGYEQMRRWLPPTTYHAFFVSPPEIRSMSSIPVGGRIATRDEVQRHREAYILSIGGHVCRAQPGTLPLPGILTVTAEPDLYRLNHEELLAH